MEAYRFYVLILYKRLFIRHIRVIATNVGYMRVIASKWYRNTRIESPYIHTQREKFELSWVKVYSIKMMFFRRNTVSREFCLIRACITQYIKAIKKSSYCTDQLLLSTVKHFSVCKAYMPRHRKSDCIINCHIAKKIAGSQIVNEKL